MNLWIDGEETTVAGQGVWNQLSTLSIPESTRSIGVKCRNTGGPYGIAGSVQDADGNDVLVTDDSWKCSNTADAGWEGPDFEEGENWQTASYYPHRNYIVHGSGSFLSYSQTTIPAVSVNFAVCCFFYFCNFLLLFVLIFVLIFISAVKSLPSRVFKSALIR